MFIFVDQKMWVHIDYLHQGQYFLLVVQRDKEKITRLENILEV